MYEVSSANHKIPHCGGKTYDIKTCKTLYFNKYRSKKSPMERCPAQVWKSVLIFPWKNTLS